uniref:Fatty acid desaturase domain-containing protein n=1 Tax=Romanomermis culicivorax TaxID=13658 RepID=A0A915K4E1_ROMCU
MRPEGDRRLVFSGIFILLLQFLLAYWAHCQVDSLSRFSINCFVGNWTASILLFHMHEAAHGTIFGPNSVFKNRLFGFILNLGVGVPFFSFFKKHHKNHHKYIGDQILDAEYPSELEAKIFPNNFAGKFCWLIFQPFIYTIRTPFLLLKYPQWWWDLEEYANLIFVTLYAALCLVSGYPYFWGHCALSALAASCSNIFGYWGIMSHTEFFPMRETFSYYGYLNNIFMNFGYHMEHHDFPNIPGKILSLQYYMRISSMNNICMEKYRKVVENNYDRIVESLEPADVVRTLVARGALLSEDMKTICSKGDRKQRNVQLLDILMKKNYWWGPFIDCLIRNNYSHLAHILMEDGSKSDDLPASTTRFHCSANTVKGHLYLPFPTERNETKYNRHNVSERKGNFRSIRLEVNVGQFL